MLALLLCLDFLFLTYKFYSEEASPGELFTKAHALFSQDQHQEATKLFIKTLDRDYVLEDYSLYYLGRAAISRGDPEEARQRFARLKELYPPSVWSRQADLELAKLLLEDKNEPEAIDRLQALRAERPRREIADEVLYLLAQIHERQGDAERAHSLYQELRHSSPLSPWSAQARKEVKRLREQYPELFNLKEPDIVLREGDLLLKEREYREAAALYQKVLEIFPQGPLRPRYLMSLAEIYIRARNREDAIPLLTEIERDYPSSPEAPNALHRLAWIHWNRDENLRALEQFNKLNDRHPNSSFNDYAHLSSARIYESLGDVNEALRLYRSFPKKFPSSKLREEAQWRQAWLHYLEADYQLALDAFRRLGKDKSAERYQTGSLYWQGRSAEKMERAEEAKEVYLQILARHNESYYAGQAAKRLEKMGVALDEKKSPDSVPETPPTLDPDLLFHYSRALELAEISLHDLAVVELDEIRDQRQDSGLRLFLMREYFRNHAYARAVALANQLHNPSDPPSRYRYPLAYWESIERTAREKEVDPHLILALIRQESVFDPEALSPASAYGLMQLLPSTAARTAAGLKLPPPQPEMLFEPDLNLTLGIHHLKELLRRYSNNLVKAIAAYNAGESAVARWEKHIAAEDEDEFIERIPYAETRQYVQLVLRNYRIYRVLYDRQK